MEESSSGWKVVLTMRPLRGEVEPFVHTDDKFDSREEAKRQALHYSCMAGTTKVEVLSPEGNLEYDYDRNTNMFRPISPEAVQLWKQESEEAHKRMLNKSSGGKN